MEATITSEQAARLKEARAIRHAGCAAVVARSEALLPARRVRDAAKADAKRAYRQAKLEAKWAWQHVADPADAAYSAAIREAELPLRAIESELGYSAPARTR